MTYTRQLFLQLQKMAQVLVFGIDIGIRYSFTRLKYLILYQLQLKYLLYNCVQSSKEKQKGKIWCHLVANL